MTKESATQAKSNPMRYIQRKDTKGHHAWKVAVRRAGQYIHQYFADAAHGGTAQALAAALAWRDQTVAELTGVDYAVWRRELMLPTNTSGIVGVSRGFVLKKRGKRTVKFAMWTAYWQNANGKRSTRSFSVNKYGEEEAKQMAISAREEGMQDVVRQFKEQST